MGKKNIFITIFFLVTIVCLFSGMSLFSRIIYNRATTEDIDEIATLLDGMSDDDAKNLVLFPRPFLDNYLRTLVMRGELFVARHIKEKGVSIIVATMKMNIGFLYQDVCGICAELGIVSAQGCPWEACVKSYSPSKDQDIFIRNAFRFYSDTNGHEYVVPPGRLKTPVVLGEEEEVVHNYRDVDSTLFIHHGMIFVDPDYRSRGVYTFLLISAFQHYRSAIICYLDRNKQINNIAFTFCQLQEAISKGIILAFIAAICFVEHDLLNGFHESYSTFFESGDRPREDTPYPFLSWMNQKHIYQAMYKTIKPGVTEKGEIFYDFQSGVKVPYVGHQLPQSGYGKVLCASLPPREDETPLLLKGCSSFRNLGRRDGDRDGEDGMRERVPSEEVLDELRVLPSLQYQSINDRPFVVSVAKNCPRGSCCMQYAQDPVSLTAVPIKVEA